MAASRPMACSRTSLMNDLSAPNLNNAVHLERKDPPAVERETGATPKRRRRRRWSARQVALDGLVTLAGGLSFGAWGIYLQQRQVTATAERERDFVPSLHVATVAASPGATSVILPGSTAAFADPNVYARATGYIAKRNVDIGDRVKAGDLLAELAVPELDDQISQNERTLAQLEASLQQAEANLKLAQVTWDRDRPLVHEGWATQQQGTVDVQTVKADEAAVAAARQNAA